MSEYFKEKYEKACSIKDKALCLVESQLYGDISSVDAKELGEVADIAKDMAELIELCSEAEYYHKICEAMDESSDEEKSEQLNKWIPEYGGKFFNRMMYTPYDHMDDDRMSYRDRMYFTEQNRVGSANTYDGKMGKSGISRKTYMDMKEKGESLKMTEQEMVKYLKSLIEDFDEMLVDAEPSEKAQFKNSLVSFINKM